MCVCICRYTDLTECMDSISLEELIMAVRRQSQGFSRGTSAYRGVTHHPSGQFRPSPTPLNQTGLYLAVNRFGSVGMVACVSFRNMTLPLPHSP